MEWEALCFAMIAGFGAIGFTEWPWLARVILWRASVFGSVCTVLTKEGVKSEVLAEVVVHNASKGVGSILAFDRIAEKGLKKSSVSII